MRLRFLALLIWVMLGHAAVAGLYWALLQVPESNVVMLVLSALVVLLIIVAAAVVEIAGLRGWSGPLGGAITQAVRRAGWIVPSVVLFVIVWWMTTGLHGWYGRHATELDAWLLLKFRWTTTAWLHRAVGWAFWFLSYGAGLSLALTLLARTAGEGRQALVRVAWIRQGLRWRQLIVVTVGVLLGIALPWNYVYWRPKNLPATWAEPAFLGAKLLVMSLVASAAWTWILRTVGTRADSA
jgi:hypothetical protein